MNKQEVLTFAKSLGLMTERWTEQDPRRLNLAVTYYFFDVHLAPRHGNRRRELIATLRLDDEMDAVDYNNALAICMITLKQYQSWS